MTDLTAQAQEWWTAHATRVQTVVRETLADPIDELYPPSSPLAPTEAPAALAMEWVLDPATEFGAAQDWRLQVERMLEVRADFVGGASLIFCHDDEVEARTRDELASPVHAVRSRVRKYLLGALGPEAKSVGSISAAVDAVAMEMADVGSREPRLAAADPQLLLALKNDQRTQDVEMVLVTRLDGAVLVLGQGHSPQLVRISLPPVLAAAAADGLRGQVRLRLMAKSAGARAVHYTWRTTTI